MGKIKVEKKNLIFQINSKRVKIKKRKKVWKDFKMNSIICKLKLKVEIM